MSLVILTDRSVHVDGLSTLFEGQQTARCSHNTLIR